MTDLISVLQHETFLEFARLGILYTHLLACCVALALILSSDLKLMRSLFTGRPSDSLSPAHMNKLQRIVTRALTALWISGAAIIGLDVFVQGADYLANPKLQAKIVVVSLLTLNGMILHHAVLPKLVKAGSLIDLSRGARWLAVTTGAMSAVSWGFAALLGIGRPLSWKYSLFEILAIYPVAVAAGALAMMALIHYARQRRQVQPQQQRLDWSTSAMG